jgi:hypothetical protein
MGRVVPSQVVELIDKLFPWAKDQKEGNHDDHLTALSISVAAMLELIQQIPSELIALDSESYVEFVSSVAALRAQMREWEVSIPIWPLPGLRDLSPVTLIRQALAKCPDAMPNLGTTELNFITDAALRESIRRTILLVRSNTDGRLERERNS